MSDEKKETKLYVPPPTGKIYWKGQMKTYLLIVFNFVLVLLVDILLLHDTAFLQYDRQTVMIVFAAAVSLLESWIYGKVRKKTEKTITRPFCTRKKSLRVLSVFPVNFSLIRQLSY